MSDIEQSPTSEVEVASVSEQLAADAATEHVEFPEGAPELREVLQLPRRVRADYYEAMSRLLDKQKDVQKAFPKGKKKEPSREELLVSMAGLSRMAAEIEDLLAIVAVDETKFREWAASVDDSTLIQLWRAWQEATQPGEATSSSS
jgi:hypothetical protein